MWVFCLFVCLFVVVVGGGVVLLYRNRYTPMGSMTVFDLRCATPQCLSLF